MHCSRRYHINVLWRCYLVVEANWWNCLYGKYSQAFCSRYCFPILMIFQHLELHRCAQGPKMDDLLNSLVIITSFAPICNKFVIKSNSITNPGPSLDIWMGFHCSTAIHSQSPSCLVQSTEMFPYDLSTLCQHMHQRVDGFQLNYCISNWHNICFIPEMYDCSCSSTMLRRSAPCCLQLILAWCHVRAACVFLWYWTPVTGSVSQPNDAGLWEI